MRSALNIAAFLVASLVWGNTALADTVNVGGTGSALEVLRHLGAAFTRENPGIEINVFPSMGSTGGQRALAAGKIDLAVSASAVKPQVFAEEPVVWEWSKSPFVIAVGRDNPVDSLSGSDVVDIYSAKLTAWPDGSRIRPVMRPPGDNSFKMLERLHPDMPTALEIAEQMWGSTAAITDQDAAEALQTIPGAIGPMLLGQMRAERLTLKPVTVDGLEPTLAAVEDGSYPHVTTYRLMARKPVGEPLDVFLAFLDSAEGREMTRSYGYLPLGGR